MIPAGDRRRVRADQEYIDLVGPVASRSEAERMGPISEAKGREEREPLIHSFQRWTKPGKDSVQVLSNCAKFRCASDTDGTIQWALYTCQLIKDVLLLHVAVQSMASRLQGFKLTPVAGNKRYAR
jgi:hypothetical protein